MTKRTKTPNNPGNPFSKNINNKSKNYKPNSKINSVSLIRSRNKYKECKEIQKMTNKSS
jgi:hypothetical protein